MVTMEAGNGTLPTKYRGKGCGKLRKLHRPCFALSDDGSVLSEQLQFRRRQKVLRQLRELVFLRRSGDGNWDICQRRLWNSILSSRAFPGGFGHWILNNDLSTHVPATPDLPWLQALDPSLSFEEKMWASSVKQRQRQLLKHARDEDGASGGAWHAAAIRPPAAATLTTLCFQHTVKVKHLRTSKASDAVFRVLDGDLPSSGSIWEFSGLRALVKKVQGSLVTIATQLKSCMTHGVVRQLVPNNDPAFIAQQVQMYWDTFWHSQRQPNLDFIRQNLDTLPKLETFDYAGRVASCVSEAPKAKS